MSKDETVHLYPVEGRSIPGIPAAEMDVDADTASVLIATGAFTTDKPAEPGTEV